MTVSGEELPIYVAEQEVDMRCVVLGERTGKIRIKESRRYHIQGYYQHQAAIRQVYRGISCDVLHTKLSGSMDKYEIYSKVEMLTDLRHYCVYNEMFAGSAYCELPIEIEVTGQELPVYFVLKSEVTPSTIDLSVKSLDFGAVYVNQQSTISFTATNTSMLPQKIAFVHLKKEISMSPNDGFAVLLPNESMEFQAAFCPVLAQQYNIDLVLRTSTNDKYVIKVKGEAVEAPISFSSSVLVMRTTGPGERVLESTMVTNTRTSSSALRFAFLTRSSRG